MGAMSESANLPVVRDESPDLLVTWLAERTRVSVVADRLGLDPAYVYFGLLVVLNWGVFAVVQYLTVGYHPLVAYRVGAVPAVAGLGGLWVSRHLVAKYEDSRTELRTVVEDEGRVPEQLAPWRLQVGFYLVLSAGMVAWLLQPGVLAQMRALQGPLGLPRHSMIYFLLRLPLVAEVSSVVVGALLVVPWRLCHGDLDLELDFSDPSRLGGLASTADLLRRATQVYFLGMFALTLFALAPQIFPDQPGVGVRPIASVGIAAAWLGGFGLFGGANLCLHREMKSEKERKLEDLREQLENHGADDDPYPDYEELSDESPDEMLPYLYLERALRQTELTQEYPTNPTLVREVAVSSLPSLVTYLATLILAALKL